jgi:hypothetical protein
MGRTGDGTPGIERASRFDPEKMRKHAPDDITREVYENTRPRNKSGEASGDLHENKGGYAKDPEMFMKTKGVIESDGSVSATFWHLVTR